MIGGSSLNHLLKHSFQRAQPNLEGALVALVALSRVALGKHYLSDVVAAAAFGVAWLALCGTVLALYRQRRLAR